MNNKAERDALKAEAIDPVLKKKEEDAKREADKERLEELAKKIKPNIVGSEKFYKFNQKFFILAFFAKLIESVTFNSMSSVPGMFLLLGLAAMYDLRKKYSRFYRTYSFFVIYYIQTMMILKLCISIYLSIESVNMKLNNQMGERLQYSSMWY